MTDLLRSSRVDDWYLTHDDMSSLARPDQQVIARTQHIAQFYESASFLLDTVREFLSVSLRTGQSAVVVATPAHRAGIAERLAADGIDLDGAVARGQYVVLDAAETLAALLVDGVPDADRFEALIGGVVREAQVHHQQVRAFGEMVALLVADGQYEAAIRLEQLWNDLRRTSELSLLCAYSLSTFGDERAAGLVEQICAAHGRVVPADSFTTLVDPDARLQAITLLQQQAQWLSREIAERRRAEDAMHALFRISEKLHTTLDLDTLLTQIVEETVGLIGTEGGWAGLRGADGLLCQRYLRLGMVVPLEYCWRPGHGLPGWLLEHRRPYVTNDALHDPQSVTDVCLQLGIWAALCVPILDAQDEVVGFVELHNKCDGTGFAEADVEKVMAVSRVASVAVQNARLYREAQEAVRLRDELLSTASHELRTPLTTVSAQAQLMLRRLHLRGSVEPDTLEPAFGMIAQQSGKLTRLIEQCLDVSRLQAGRLTLTRERTEVGELLQRLADAAAVRGRQPIVVQAPTGIWAWVDPLRLDQMVTNLLDNAIKYGAQDRPIELTLAGPTCELIEITVRDYGSGIPVESRAHLFERFFQGHAAGYQSGMGLGLYISQQIAELHGGHIEAEAPADGGTRFVIRLPVGLPADPAAD